jgi:hypothetical protein
MARTPVQFNGFGFGDSFEREVFRRHQDFFESVISLNNALNEITGRGGPAEPREKLIVNLALMGMTDAVAIITLVGNGMGPTAMQLARSAMETSINAEILRLDPVAAEDFLEWQWVEQRRLIAWAEQNDVKILASIGGPTIDEIEANYARVRPRFLTQKGRIRSSWSADRLDVRARKAGCEESYRLIHPLTCEFVHGSVGGMFKHFTSADEYRITPPPTHEWDRQALLSAHGAMLRLVQTLCLTFNTDTKPPLQELQEDYLRIWKE